MKIKVTITGKSLLELHKEYGVGNSGFYSSDPWWKNEAFAKEKPEPGQYEITFDKKSVNKTHNEQFKEIKKGFAPAHPAVVTEAVLAHFRETGKRLLEDWYVRAPSLDSDGLRVIVGYFDARGLSVDHCWDDYRDSRIGVSAARKLRNLKPGELETFDPSNLESRVKKLEEDIEKIRKFLVF